MVYTEVYTRADCHDAKWAEFIEAMGSGQRFEVDEEMFDYWMDVLPPVLMNQNILFFPGRKGIPTPVSFGFAEGADYITVFWVDGPKEGPKHFYGQRTDKMARG
jgi:hypothetical protein